MSDINVDLAGQEEWRRWSGDLSYVGFSDPPYPPAEDCFQAGFAAGVELAEHQEHWGQDMNCYWCVKETNERAEHDGTHAARDADGDPPPTGHGGRG